MHNLCNNFEKDLMCPDFVSYGGRHQTISKEALRLLFPGFISFTINPEGDDRYQSIILPIYSITANNHLNIPLFQSSRKEFIPADDPLKILLYEIPLKSEAACLQRISIF